MLAEGITGPGRRMPVPLSPQGPATPPPARKQRQIIPGNCPYLQRASPCAKAPSASDGSRPSGRISAHVPGKEKPLPTPLRPANVVGMKRAAVTTTPESVPAR
ncbi:hypothetical protein SHO565_55010 [Streptomyces sp. HO565]